MIRLPLFGQDSSPQYTAPRMAALGTAILWLIFFLLMVFVPINKPTKYETVKIVLDPLPEVPERLVDKQENVAVSAKEKLSQEREVSKSVTEKIQEKPVETKQLPKVEPVKQEQKKQESPKSVEKSPSKAPAQSKPAEKNTPVPVKTVKSVEERMAEAAAAKKSLPKEIDWDKMFGDDNVDITSSTAVTQNPGRKMDNSEALSGSAGTTASTVSQRQISQATSSTKTKNNAVSDSTNAILGKIAETSFMASNEISESVAKIRSEKSSDGFITMEMTDGTSRRLISPKNPKIDISPDSAKLINGSPTVKILFTVHMQGNVSFTEIEIKPAALLPAAVQNEIKQQVSTWLFEKAQVTSTAQFDFTIIKK